MVASNLEVDSASPLKVDYGLAARTALQNVKQELATKEVEQWVRSELESTDLRENFNLLGKTTKKKDKEEPRKQRLKLNVISGRTFGMTKEETKIMSIISVAGHQVVKNLSESSEITLVHLDIYADYLREKGPKLDSRAVRALLTTGGPRLMRVDGPYIEVHRIVVSDMMDSLVGLDEVAVLEEIDLVNDMDQDWIDDRSEPEVEFEPEAEQTHEQELTILRVLEWLHDLPTDPKETILTIQDVDKDGIKYVSHDNTESNWVAPDGPLRVSQPNLDLLDFGRSTGRSMDIFVRGVGVGLIHTENLIIKKLKSAREIGELETEGENAKKTSFRKNF